MVPRSPGCSRSRSASPARRRVSYLCVFCPELEHTVFPLEPKILSIEEDLVLRVIVTTSTMLPTRPRAGGTSRHHQLRPHRDTAGDFFVVAGLCRARNAMDTGEFVPKSHGTRYAWTFRLPGSSSRNEERERYGILYGTVPGTSFH
ncbi:hypothetical protein BAE44_0000015 [Dichanthelium oligosanthes]|uniref:Uncharacterized protein n=1 Tax=Dichanthelium oligosanthes TaxID=888268 RepID=A0A1E5WNI5_9POAL|nr:hypothetical protein BAE44_0000015 [Dichanthelium oligosanthes]